MANKKTLLLLSAFILTNLTPASAQQTKNLPPTKPQNLEGMGMAPTCNNDWKADFNAEFLWWATNFNALSGADVKATSTTALDINIHVKHPDLTWDPGVRLALGGNTGYDNWDIQGAWTFFYNSVKDNNPVNVDIPDGLVPLMGQAKHRFRYNAGDIELGKSFYISPNFFVRPFTGIHGIVTSIQNSLVLSLPDDITIMDPTGFGANTSLNLGSWGVGPRLGVNTNWGNFRGFSLVGNISGSLVYGQHYNQVVVRVAPSGDQIVNVRIRGDQYWQLMPTTQIQFGLGYGCCFGKNQFRVNATWESNFIWEAANFLIFDKSISMQGLTFDIGFIF